MQLLKALNLGLAFLLELCLVCAAGYIGFAAAQPVWLRWVLAIVLVAVVVAVWARWAAFRSPTRLSDASLLALKSLLFAAAALGLALTGLPWLGLALFVAAGVNLALGQVWDQEPV